MFPENKIIVITGQPANGKTTVGNLLALNHDFTCIEGDTFITPSGKSRLNDGSWDDVDRKIYLSRMAATAVESHRENPKTLIVDCLTTRWMREYLVSQVSSINQQLSVGFILLHRELTDQEISDIASQRSAAGHALDKNALLQFRQAFEDWDPALPWVSVDNPGNNDLNLLTSLTLNAILTICNQ